MASSTESWWKGRKVRRQGEDSVHREAHERRPLLSDMLWRRPVARVYRIGTGVYADRRPRVGLGSNGPTNQRRASPAVGPTKMACLP